MPGTGNATVYKTDKIPTLMKLTVHWGLGRQSINKMYGMPDVPECRGGSRSCVLVELP